MRVAIARRAVSSSARPFRSKSSARTSTLTKEKTYAFADSSGRSRFVPISCASSRKIHLKRACNATLLRIDVRRIRVGRRPLVQGERADEDAERDADHGELAEEGHPGAANGERGSESSEEPGGYLLHAGLRRVLQAMLYS